jgi:hypothetical protein
MTVTYPPTEPVFANAAEDNTVSSFEPARYLKRVNGADYLEVKWRLVWLRDRHPDADITTKLHLLQDNLAVFVCHIVLPNGGGSATGWGSETAGDFRDYIEKAETKSIGRALAALGFGTQFSGDLNEGTRIVDNPTQMSARGSAASNVVPINGSAPSRVVVDKETGEITRQKLTINELTEGIKSFREVIHWSAQDVLKEAEKFRWNMKQKTGLELMYGHLEEIAVRIASDDDDDEEEEETEDVDWSEESR